MILTGGLGVVTPPGERDSSHDRVVETRVKTESLTVSTLEITGQTVLC